MTFANFIVIQYALVIKQLPELKFVNLPIFAAIFVAGYIPLATIIGYWHRKSQWKVEQEAAFHENIIGARMWLFMLELIEGNVTEDEKKQMRTMLRQIIKRDSGAQTANSPQNVVEEVSKVLEQQKGETKKL